MLECLELKAILQIFFLSPFFFHVSTELRSQMFLRVENIQETQNALRSLEVPKILQLLQIVLSSSYCNTSTKAEHDWCIKHLGKEKKIASVPVTLEKMRQILFSIWMLKALSAQMTLLLINKVFKMKFLRHMFLVMVTGRFLMSLCRRA